jgi:hypothetical protein
MICRVQDPDQVRRWVSEAEAEVIRISEEAERVGRQLADARRRVALLHEILAAVASNPEAMQESVRQLSTRERVIRDAEAILGDERRPLRIGDLHAEFIRRGFALPGRGSPTNLVAHLGQTERIIRLERGVYALPDRAASEAKSAPHGAEEK